MTKAAARRNLRLLNWTSFLNGFRGFEGVIAVYFASITGSFTAGMAALAIMHVSSSVLEVPTGILSDQIGRKKTIILYHLCVAIALVIYYLAETTAVLYVGCALFGLSMALRSGTISGFVYENLELLGKADRFNRFEGKRKAVERYALVVAGVLGTGIIYFYDIRTTVLIAAIALGVALVISFFISDIAHFRPNISNIFSDIDKAWRNFLADPMLRDISLGKLLATGAGNAEYRFRSLFFETIMPMWVVNLLGTINNLISGIAMQVTHATVKKFGIKRMLVDFDIFDRAFTAIAALTQSVLGALGMNVISSITFGTRIVAAEDLLQQGYSKDQRATMGSLVGLGGSIVYIIVAVGAGALADFTGTLFTLVALQPVLLIGTYFFYQGVRLKRKEVK